MTGYLLVYPVFLTRGPPHPDTFPVSRLQCPRWERGVSGHSIHNTLLNYFIRESPTQYRHESRSRRSPSYGKRSGGSIADFGRYL